MPTVAAASAGKAMGKDAALKILGKRFAHEGLGGVGPDGLHADYTLVVLA